MANDPGEEAAAEALADDYGYRIVTLAEFLASDFAVPELDGDTLVELQARARQYAAEGDHVIFDPYGDGDGWLMVGSRGDCAIEAAGMLSWRDPDGARVPYPTTD